MRSLSNSRLNRAMTGEFWSNTTPVPRTFRRSPGVWRQFSVRAATDNCQIDLEAMVPEADACDSSSASMQIEPHRTMPKSLGPGLLIAATLMGASATYAQDFVYSGAETSPINPASPTDLGGSIIIQDGASVTTQFGGNHAIQPWAGPSTGAWNVQVDGTVQVLTPNTEIYGVWLRNGGTVTVGASGSVLGSNKGIVIEGAAGQVVNDGLISGATIGTHILNGGSVQNNATITGGVVFATSVTPGSFTNNGSVSSSAFNGFGVIMNGGGSLNNAGTLSFHNIFAGFSSYEDVTFSNTGDIVATADSSYATQVYGAILQQGQVNVTNDGRIEGRDLGLRAYQGPSALVSNSGVIKAGLLDAVRLEPLGEATYSQTAGSVEGGRHGLYVNTPGKTTITLSGGTVTAGMVNNAGVGVMIAGAGETSLTVGNATISGAAAAIKGGTGAFDVILGSGSTVNGDILLGSGRSNLTMDTGATVNGNVDAGLGGEALKLVGTGKGVFAGSFTNFKSAEINAAGGSWTLSGASSFADGIQVNAGTLIVNGSLDGSVTTGPDSILQGSGSIGALTIGSGSIVAPGNSIGTLSVNGNVTFAAGSTYQLEINGAGQSDRIAATGTATLSGGTVKILPDQGTGFKADSPYTILTASGGVTGAFSGTTGGEFAFVTPTLGYNNDTVTLTLVRKTVPQPPTPPHPPKPPVPPSPPMPVAFNSVAVTTNQYSTANGVEALGAGNRLYDNVLGASVAGARQAFTALSGEAHASAITVAYEDDRLVREAILTRLRQPTATSLPAFAQGSYSAAYAADLPGAPQQPVAVVPSFDPRRFALWGEGFGSWGQVRANGNAAGLDRSTGGFILGADAELAPAVRLGVAGGFTRTSFDIDGRLSSGANESVFGALYGSGRWGALNLRLGASYAAHDIDVSRTVIFPGFGDAAEASYDGSSVQAFGELGYGVSFGSALIEPFVGASVLRLHIDSFQESGGAAALTGFGRTYELGTTTLGVRAEARLSEAVPLTLRGLLGWRRAYGDVEPAALLAFAGGASAFAVSGVPVDRNALAVEAGLDWQASDAISLGVAYSGQIGSHAQDHALKGNFTWRFDTR